MPKKAVDKEQPIVINEIEMTTITFCVLGTSPLIMNRFQQKAWQELLLPSARKNHAERAATLKHDPVAEFRGAAYRNRDLNSPAYTHIPNGSFKGALASAALDIPGATKAKMERLTAIVETNIDLFGIPNIFCAMVRNSDMNRTPDVRTRPIFPEWAAKVSVRYVRSLLTERTIANLFGAAGMIVGIGDWRPQKNGSYGCWKCVPETDADFKRITAKQGRKAQEAAFATPIYFDEDTEELLTWFEKEIRVREREGMLDGGKDAGRRKYNAPRVPVIDEDVHGNLQTVVKANGRGRGRRAAAAAA